MAAASLTWLDMPTTQPTWVGDGRRVRRREARVHDHAADTEGAQRTDGSRNSSPSGLGHAGRVLEDQPVGGGGMPAEVHHGRSRLEHQR